MRFYWERVAGAGCWWILWDEQTRRSSGTGVAAIKGDTYGNKVYINIPGVPYISYIDNDSSAEEIQAELLSIFQESS